MLKDMFAAVSGSVVGFEHRRIGKNNQDGMAIIQQDDVIAAVVCDGCSSAKFSEVGARLLSRHIAENIVRLARQNFDADFFLNELFVLTVHYIRAVAQQFNDPCEVVDELMLATILGAAITKDCTTVFSLGDGIVSLNGETLIIDENNSPNYAAYAAFPGFYFVDQTKVKFVVRQKIRTEELQNILLATDGARDIISKSQMKIWGGAEEIVGELSQFVDQERYVKNSSLLQKRLFQLNMPHVHVDWENRTVERSEGVLSDDTTIVLIKRR